MLLLCEMKVLGGKTMVWLSFLAAAAVFIVVGSLVYPIWLNSDNLLKIIADQPVDVAADIINRLSFYAFIGGLAITSLAGLSVFIFLVTRSRAVVASSMVESQQWLEELYEEAPVPYLLMIPKGALESPNKAALRLFGCTADVLKLLTLKDVVVEEDRTNVNNLLYHYNRKRPINNEPIRIESKNKEIRWVLLSIFSGGKMGHSSGKALVTMVDVSEQKRLESELRTQFNEVRKFAKAAEVSTDGVVITDSKGHITYANTAWMQLTGYTITDIAEMDIKTLHGESTLPHVLAKADEALRGMAAFKSEEMTYRRKDGREYNAEVEIIPIVEERGTSAQFYVYTERDISKRKEIDRAKSEFVSLASHQLRTPLLSMQWYAEMMLSGDTGVLAAKQREYLEKMYNGSRNLAELVQLFLDVSKIEMGALQIQPTTFDVETVVMSVVEELQPDIEKKMLRIEKRNALKQDITTDARLLRVVIQNLVSNAVKYTPAEGILSIAIDKSENSMLFTIEDSGCGIPTEQQHLIFSKMFRAHNAAKAAAHGSGLGLYMTKSLIESLGGTISFTSILDRGTTFTVSVPLAANLKSV